MKPSSAPHVESWPGLADLPRSLASIEDERLVAPRRKNFLFILKASLRAAACGGRPRPATDT
jgi:hypothetical protein